MKTRFKAEFCSPPRGMPFLFSIPSQWTDQLSIAISELDFILLAIFPSLFNPFLPNIAKTSIFIKENLEYTKYCNRKKHPQLCHHTQLLTFWRCFDLSLKSFLIYIFLKTVIITLYTQFYPTFLTCIM